MALLPNWCGPALFCYKSINDQLAQVMRRNTCASGDKTPRSRDYQCNPLALGTKGFTLFHREKNNMLVVVGKKTWTTNYVGKYLNWIVCRALGMAEIHTNMKACYFKQSAFEGIAIGRSSPKEVGGNGTDCPTLTVGISTRLSAEENVFNLFLYSIHEFTSKATFIESDVHGPRGLSLATSLLSWLE